MLKNNSECGKGTNLIQVETSPIHPTVFTDSEAATIRRAFKIIEKKRFRQEPILYFLEDFYEYLVLRFAGLTNEQHHVLYLDLDQRLLEVDIDGLGDQKSVSYDMRKMALKAISLGAEHVVFAHNHPNNSPAPSENDVNVLTYSEMS